MSSGFNQTFLKVPMGVIEGYLFALDRIERSVKEQVQIQIEDDMIRFIAILEIYLYRYLKPRISYLFHLIRRFSYN